MRALRTPGAGLLAASVALLLGFYRKKRTEAGPDCWLWDPRYPGGNELHQEGGGAGRQGCADAGWEVPWSGC